MVGNEIKCTYHLERKSLTMSAKDVCTYFTRVFYTVCTYYIYTELRFLAADLHLCKFSFDPLTI